MSFFVFHPPIFAGDAESQAGRWGAVWRFCRRPPRQRWMKGWGGAAGGESACGLRPQATTQLPVRQHLAALLPWWCGHAWPRLAALPRRDGRSMVPLGARGGQRPTSLCRERQRGIPPASLVRWHEAMQLHGRSCAGAAVAGIGASPSWSWHGCRLLQREPVGALSTGTGG